MDQAHRTLRAGRWGVALLLLGALAWPPAAAAQAAPECEPPFGSCRAAARAVHRDCVTSCPRQGPCRTQCDRALDLTLGTCANANQACEQCAPLWQPCRAGAGDAHETCVTACPRTEGECVTQCDRELDLTTGLCRVEQEACEECELGCDRAARRCTQRARDGARGCGLGCVQALVAELRRCAHGHPPLAGLFCSARALGALDACGGACRQERADDLAWCGALDGGCRTVCHPYVVPDFGAYGTLSNFSVRQEVHLGCERHYPGSYPDVCAHPVPFGHAHEQRAGGGELIDLPWMTTRFLVRHAGAHAAVTFSAIEATNLSENHHDARAPILVRALIDDQVIAPGEVRISRTALASGGAFTFVSGPLAEGIHIAKLQWRAGEDPLATDAPVALLRSGTLLVRSGAPLSPDGDAGAGLAVASAAPPEADTLVGPPMVTGAWEPVRGEDGVTPLSVDFLVPTDAAVAITFSAEVSGSLFGALDVRARLAEGPLDAGQVMYAQHFPAPSRGVWPPAVDGLAARAFTFTSTALKPGWNTVELDWRYRYREGLIEPPVAGIQSVAMQRRTVAVAAASRRDPYSRLEIVAPSPLALAAPLDWQPIADLSRTVAVPDNAQVAVTFDGEISATNLVHLRLTRDGVPVADGEVTLTQGADATGAFTHTWAVKHLPAGDHTFGVDWQVSGNGAAATLGTRNLVLAIEELPVPDLGDGPDVAAGAGPSTDVEHPVEPIDGTRPVLVVLVDPQRPQVDEITVEGTPDGLYSVIIDGESHDVLAAGDSATAIRDALIEAINAGGQPVSAEATVSNSATALAALRIVADTLGANQFSVTLVSPDGVSLLRCPAGSCHAAPVPDTAALYDLAFGDDQSAAAFWRVVSGGRLQLVPAGPGVIGPFHPDFTGLEAIDHYWRSAHNCDAASVDDVYRSGHAERFAQGLLAAAAAGEVDFAAYDRNGDGHLTPRELTIVVATPQSSNGGSAFDSDFRPFCDLDQRLELDGVELRGLISWYTGNGASLSDVTTLAHELGHFPVGLDDLYTQADHDPWHLSIMSLIGSGYWQQLDGFQKLALGWAAPRQVRAPGIYELEDVKSGGEVLILPRPGSFGREYFLIENRQATALGDPLYDQALGDSGLAVYHIVEPTYAGAFACQSEEPGVPDCALMFDAQCPSGFSFATGNYVRRAVRLIRPGVLVQSDGSAALWDAGEGELTDAAPVCQPATPAAGLVWSDGSPSGYTLGPLPANAPTMAVPIAIAP